MATLRAGGRQLPDATRSSLRKLAIWLTVGTAIAILTSFLPLVGFDYQHVFGTHGIPVFYPPWTDGMMYLLNWPLLVALTVMTLVIAIERYGLSISAVVMAVFSFPTLWVLFLGQLEGIALLGLLLMRWSVPVWLIEHWRETGRQKRWVLMAFVMATVVAAVVIGMTQGPRYHHEASTELGRQPEVGFAMILLLSWIVPIVLLKPQLTAFALLSKRSWLLAGVLWMLVSFIIWGFWLPNVIQRVTPGIRADQPQDVSLFPWSLVIAIPMLWLARSDVDMLMAAGSLASPTVQAYQYIVFMPALARLPLGLRTLCWLSSFLPLTANYFGPQFWLTSNIFPLLMWLCLWWQRRRKPPTSLA